MTGKLESWVELFGSEHLPPLLPDPVMATAMEDGSGPRAVSAPASETDALTMVRPWAALNSIPGDPGPKTTSTLPGEEKE